MRALLLALAKSIYYWYCELLRTLSEEDRFFIAKEG